MKKTITTLCSLLILLLLQSCGNKILVQEYGNGEYKWTGKGQIVYEFPLNMKEKIETSVFGVVEHLNKDILGKNMIVARWVDFDSNSYTGEMDGKNRVYFPSKDNAREKEYFDGFILGVTSMWGMGISILEADISFFERNDGFFYYEGYSDPLYAGYDFWGILSHEMGHALGLDHNNTEAGNVMASTISMGDVSQRYFSQVEIDELHKKYR